MNLTTQIPYPGTAPRKRSDSGKSVASNRSHEAYAPKAAPGTGARARRGADCDGWQTVQRKR
jgi:hypothetical protein